MQTEELMIWQKAHLLVMSVYQFVASLPESGLACELKASAVELAVNTAEMARTKSPAPFLKQAILATERCRYYIDVLGALSFSGAPELKKHIEQVERLLTTRVPAAGWIV
jgi:hypothetical protein